MCLLRGWKHLVLCQSVPIGAKVETQPSRRRYSGVSGLGAGWGGIAGSRSRLRISGAVGVSATNLGGSGAASALGWGGKTMKNRRQSLSKIEVRKTNGPWKKVSRITKEMYKGFHQLERHLPSKKSEVKRNEGNNAQLVAAFTKQWQQNQAESNINLYLYQYLYPYPCPYLVYIYTHHFLLREPLAQNSRED